jgi:hypothetical protein
VTISAWIPLADLRLEAGDTIGCGKALIGKRSWCWAWRLVWNPPSPAPAWLKRPRICLPLLALIVYGF